MNTKQVVSKRYARVHDHQQPLVFKQRQTKNIASLTFDFTVMENATPLAEASVCLPPSAIGPRRCLAQEGCGQLPPRFNWVLRLDFGALCSAEWAVIA